jgi:hypothetical protein
VELDTIQTVRPLTMDGLPLAQLVFGAKDRALRLEPVAGPWRIDEGLETTAVSTPPWTILVQKGRVVGPDGKAFLSEDQSIDVMPQQLNRPQDKAVYLLVTMDGKAELKVSDPVDPVGPGRPSVDGGIPLAELRLKEEENGNRNPKLVANPDVFDRVARTPEEFLPWLAGWVALSLQEDWSSEEKRRFISRMVPLYRKRGTTEGLSELLELFTGLSPSVLEGPDPDIPPGGRFNYAPHKFKVYFVLPEGSNSTTFGDKAKIAERIIQQEKPAHTAGRLFLL